MAQRGMTNQRPPFRLQPFGVTVQGCKIVTHNHLKAGQGSDVPMDAEAVREQLQCDNSNSPIENRLLLGGAGRPRV